MSEERLINVIYSFVEIPQFSRNLRFQTPPSEADFLYHALTVLAVQGNRLPRLRKISACQIAAKPSEPNLTWLKENNGKYFFGPAEGAQ